MPVSSVMSGLDRADRRTMPRATLALLSALLVPVLTGACASTGAVPKPFPLPGATTAAAPPATRSNSGDRIDGYAVTSMALSLRGTAYRNGGTTPTSGFDCSGFTQYVFAQYGLALPREVRDQY